MRHYENGVMKFAHVPDCSSRYLEHHEILNISNGGHISAAAAQDTCSGMYVNRLGGTSSPENMCREMFAKALGIRSLSLLHYIDRHILVGYSTKIGMNVHIDVFVDSVLLFIPEYSNAKIAKLLARESVPHKEYEAFVFAQRDNYSLYNKN